MNIVNPAKAPSSMPNANTIRLQLAKTTFLAALTFISLLGLVETLRDGSWLTSLLFLVSAAGSIALLNRAADGVQFLRRLKRDSTRP